MAQEAIKKLVEEVIVHVGGKKNIISAENCMTRLRITVVNDDKIDEEKLKDIDGVLGIVHDTGKYVEVVVGPGKSRQCADYCKEIGVGTDPVAEETEEKNLGVSDDWKSNKDQIKGKQKKGGIRGALKIFGEIFVPLIPGIMTAGLCGGIAMLLISIIPGWKAEPVWGTIILVLQIIQKSFMGYIAAWAGYRTAERFGGTPILGGMIGMITVLDQIKDIAALTGLDNLGALGAVLTVGRGGVIAAVIGAYFVAKLEQKVRKHMHPNIDIVCTPLISVIVVAFVYILIIMPITGFIAQGIGLAVQYTIMSDSAVVRCISGYVTSACFLPLVAVGMHHALIAIYTVQLQEIGYITLYPALCMAGAGQVGAAIAIYIRAKKLGKIRMCRTIVGCLPAGLLGVGEPLVYGVTLPLGRPFLTAGLGAGFGGAFVIGMQCASTSWGASGLLGPFIVTAGPNGPALTILYYLIGYVIALVGGFLITRVGVTEKYLQEQLD